MTSSEGVVADLADSIGAIRERKRANRAGGDAAFSKGGGSTYPDPGEYVGDPFLVVPYRPNDGGDRPLPRRPSGPEPLKNSSVNVIQNGAPPKRILSGESYDLSCTVRNDGDGDVPPTPVEFFVEHRPVEGTFDATKGTIEIAAARSQPITGWTTLPSNRRLSIRIEGLGGRSIVLTPLTTLSRTFSSTLDASRVSVGTTGTATLFATVGGVVRELDSVPIQVVADPTENAGPLPLSGPVDEVTFVAHRRVRLGGQSTASVSVPYTTPANRDDRALMVVYVRAYSLSPLDVPSDFGTLDHTTSRFVGRTEQFWGIS